MSNKEKKHLSKDEVKRMTAELYDSLPMDLEQRKACIDVRDKLIEINMQFFKYVASNTYAEGADFEDKLQTALMSFMGMWWKYKWTPKYRDDLSFAVFFKPRISEEIQRYLNPISYTIKRQLCLKVANQLGKKWTEVVYSDIAKAKLSPEDSTALCVILGKPMPDDIMAYEEFIPDNTRERDTERYRVDDYDTIEEFLIQEMRVREERLSDKDLCEYADLLTIPFEELKAALPRAMETLYKRLKENT